MRLTKWASNCESGPCPTVWGTDGTDVIAQGFKVDDPWAFDESASEGFPISR